MTSDQILARLVELAIIPAVRTSTPEAAVRAANALAAGGVTNLELPVTVPGALDVICILRCEHGDGWIVGAGTVLDASTARAAILAGAQFIVSPTLDVDVIACCKRYSIPVFPGALTPTEILTAWDAGADIVKVFPASALGGASYIKALRGPLPQIKTMPMGGVSIETAFSYLEAGATTLGIGGDLVSTTALDAGDDHLITQKARAYLEILQAFKSQEPRATRASCINASR